MQPHCNLFGKVDNTKWLKLTYDIGYGTELYLII